MESSEQSQDLNLRIKSLLSQDSQFRREGFDPSPYIIKILKEKESNQDSILEHKNNLVQLQNEAFELIGQIVTAHKDDFQKMLEVPQVYGEQLERLKGHMSVVKKKVKETKAQLLNTQKDIQQCHYNCMYNKLIYQRLKEIEGKLLDYQNASVALKNNQFLACSLNLSYSGAYKSILENTLANRFENLRIRLVSRAIEELGLFIYFTPKLVAPSMHATLDAATDTQTHRTLQNQAHQVFYKRYLLFQKAPCLQYLQSIWKFPDLQKRTGRVKSVEDIVKGIMNIGRINEITQAIEIDSKKSVQNIFTLLFYFLGRDSQPQKQNPRRWFLDPPCSEAKTFVSTVFCICGSIFRKLIIFRKILRQYGARDLTVGGAQIMRIVKNQIRKMIKLLFFPSMVEKPTRNYDYVYQQILCKVLGSHSYVIYGIIRPIILKSLLIITQNVAQIEKQQFSCNKMNSGNCEQIFGEFDSHFDSLFHTQFCNTLQNMFLQECRSFMIESSLDVCEGRQFSSQRLSFLNSFTEGSKKVVREYFYLIDLLQKLKIYFLGSAEANEQPVNYDEEPSFCKFKKYVLLLMMVFYLRLHHHVLSHLIPSAKFQQVLQIRKTDKKCKKKLKNLYQSNYRLIDQKIQSCYTEKVGKKKNVREGDFVQYKLIERLRVLQKQNQMLFAFSSQYFQSIQKEVANEAIKESLQVMDSLQPLNYDQSLNARMVRIWDRLPNKLQAMNIFLAAVFFKLLQLYFNISTYIYMQSGSF